MSRLLIDTSALHALNYARDDNHTQAVTSFKTLAGRVKPILTGWVFVETMNLPNCWLKVEWLWQDPLPKVLHVARELALLGS